MNSKPRLSIKKFANIYWWVAECPPFPECDEDCDPDTINIGTVKFITLDEAIEETLRFCSGPQTHFTIERDGTIWQNVEL